VSNTAPDIYLATVLLERNRWAETKTPTFRVSDWTERIHEAGFDGIELWENHYVGTDADERCALQAVDSYVRLFNTYCGFGDSPAERTARQYAAEAIASLGVHGCKFNIGPDREGWSTEIANLRAWQQTLPESCQLLCECHPGTVIESPDDAGAFFQEADLRNWGIIVHLANGTINDLTSWFDAFGDRVAHCHAVLGRNPDDRQRLLLMRERGFKSTISIEFTRGVAQPNEQIDALFSSAIADMAVVRETWLS